jgi:phosphotransferase system HPr-like phosphotransfer protein
MDAPAVRTRLRAALKFLDAAAMFIDESDAASWQVAGANAVDAGIAASDAICGHVLGFCAQGADHREAVRTLEAATAPDPTPTRHLRTLLDQKGDFQYGTAVARQDSANKLVTAAEKLVSKAVEVTAR